MATLLLENGPDKGKGLELSPGVTYTLGRDPGCEFVVSCELVSRHHCRVKEWKGAYFVKDLDSLNGVACHPASGTGTIAVSYDASGHAVLTCST